MHVLDFQGNLVAKLQHLPSYSHHLILDLGSRAFYWNYWGIPLQTYDMVFGTGEVNWLPPSRSCNMSWYSWEMFLHFLRLFSNISRRALPKLPKSILFVCNTSHSSNSHWHSLKYFSIVLLRIIPIHENCCYSNWSLAPSSSMCFPESHLLPYCPWTIQS